MFSGAITAKRMKIDPIVSDGIVAHYAGRSPAVGRQTSAGWGKQAIFELNASIYHVNGKRCVKC